MRCRQSQRAGGGRRGLRRLCANNSAKAHWCPRASRWRSVVCVACVGLPDPLVLLWIAQRALAHEQVTYETLNRVDEHDPSFVSTTSAALTCLRLPSVISL